MVDPEGDAEILYQGEYGKSIFSSSLYTYEDVMSLAIVSVRI